MDVILAAIEQESFSYHGSYWDLPPAGIPDRGGQVEQLTLVPRPLYPYEIWQAITSPPTLEHVPARGFGGVFWLLHHEFVRQRWERYAEIYEEHQGSAPAPGEKRQLVLNIRVEDSHEQAWDAGPHGSRRVLEVPRAVRVVEGVHGRGRQAGTGWADPDAGGVGRAEGVGHRQPRRRSPKASPPTATPCPCATSPCSPTSPATPTTRPRSR